MRLVADFIYKDVPGWLKLPSFFPGEDIHSYLRKDGVNFIISIKNYGILQMIHATLAPIKISNLSFTAEDWEKYLVEVAPEVIESFFGERKFLRAPDDPKKPDAKHFMSILEQNEL